MIESGTSVLLSGIARLISTELSWGMNSFGNMLQMWMVGCNVDGECAACNESMCMEGNNVVHAWYSDS